MATVTNNTTRIRIGYRIYSLWRFITAHITITENILTLALVASWILLSEQHCTDSLTPTTNWRILAHALIPETDWRKLTGVYCLPFLNAASKNGNTGPPTVCYHATQQWKHWPSYCWLPCNATIPEWWAYPWKYCRYLVTTIVLHSNDGLRSNTSQYL
jgi:hypothetical protein